MSPNTAERLARLGLLRAPLLLAWKRAWLPAPSGECRIRLRDGRLLVGDMSDHTQRRMLLDAFEPNETQLVRKLLKPGDTFVDAGAHIGWFTTLASELVGSSGRVWAFEPFAQSYRFLVENVALNGATNVVTSQIALAAGAGRVVVGVQAGSDSGSVTAGPRSATRRDEIDTASLDVLLPEGEQIALLKVDVEGFEFEVLSGASATLDRTAAVLIELNESALRACGSDPRRVRECLADHGLTAQSTLGGPTLAPLRPHLSASYTNLLARRG